MGLSFLTDSLFLPLKNVKLFFALYSILTVGYFLGTIFWYLFSIYPLLTIVKVEVDTLQTLNPKSAAYADLVAVLKQNTISLIVQLIFYTLLAVAISFVLRLVTLFATTYTRLGEHQLTLLELVQKIKDNFKPPALTLALVYALQLVYGLVFSGLIVLTALLYTFSSQIVLAIIVGIATFAIYLGLIYFVIVSWVSVVLAVDDDYYCLVGVKKALHLVKAKKLAALFLVGTIIVLSVLLVPLLRITENVDNHSHAAGLAVGFVYSAISVVFDLFILSASTVLYFEGKASLSDAGLYQTLIVEADV